MRYGYFFSLPAYLVIFVKLDSEIVDLQRGRRDAALLKNNTVLFTHALANIDVLHYRLIFLLIEGLDVND